MTSLKSRRRSSARMNAFLYDAQLAQRSYNQTLSHFMWMASLELNEHNAVRIARKVFDDIINLKLGTNG